MLLDEKDLGKSEEIERLLRTIRQIKEDISQRINMIENLDLLLVLSTHLILEKQNEFKAKIANITQKREKLKECDINQTRLKSILGDLHEELTSIKHEQDNSLGQLNLQKTEASEQMEEMIAQLDFYFNQLNVAYENCREKIDQTRQELPPSEVDLINATYTIPLQEIEQYVAEIEALQSKCWKYFNADSKFLELITEQNLHLTESGTLETQDGNNITFAEAKNQGFFDHIFIPFETLIPFVKTLPRIAKSVKGSLDWSATSKESSIYSRMSSEEVAYLKLVIGKPLSTAIAEIVTIQPKDPIHYLGHWLFKYRHNQDVDEIQKVENEELQKKRKLLSDERWKKFIEEEARAAVIEMVLRAEKIAYENEMKRIEEEMARMAAEEGEDALLEEARDTFV